MIQHTESVISCQKLTHYYGKRLIYKDLSFEVPKGRILGLLGKNGTGKTTTINILNGYLKPYSGTCYMFGEDRRYSSAKTRERIALLIEGHVQYAFMNVEQIEKFYAPFYPLWDRTVYYELIAKLKINPKQPLSHMSCGQRSQVALGLILAQNADLLILDDFSMGLDPGYRRLFIEYLREYAKSEDKTVFLTSHIIQDMEQLIDDCIILDYGKILIQKPITELMKTFHRYTFEVEKGQEIPTDPLLYSSNVVRQKAALHTFVSPQEMNQWLEAKHIKHSPLTIEPMTLEDLFIGLTGKY